MRRLLPIALLLDIACATRSPLAWRIENRTLAPPATRPVTVKTRVTCPATAAISAQSKRGGTRLTVDAAELAKQPAGWLATWTWQAEQSGCIPQGQSALIATQLADTAPLPLGMRYRLRHPDHARAGYVDLGPEHRLEVILPKLREGAATKPEAMTVTQSSGGLTVEMKAPDLIGVETSWWALRAGRLQPLDARATLFPDTEATLWRLVYKSGQSSALVAANTRADLEQATAAVTAGDTNCAHCLTVPRAVAVNPYLAVNVNGKEVRTPVGATIRRLIRDAGKQPEEVLLTLTIEKMYQGRSTPVKFERTKPDVLDLVLEGDETVRW